MKSRTQSLHKFCCFLCGPAALTSRVCATPAARGARPMSFECWASVYDAGPTFKRHWAMVWSPCSRHLTLWVIAPSPSFSLLFPITVMRHFGTKRLHGTRRVTQGAPPHIVATATARHARGRGLNPALGIRGFQRKKSTPSIR